MHIILCSQLYVFVLEPSTQSNEVKKMKADSGMHIAI